MNPKIALAFAGGVVLFVMLTMGEDSTLSRIAESDGEEIAAERAERDEGEGDAPAQSQSAWSAAAAPISGQPTMQGGASATQLDNGFGRPTMSLGGRYDEDEDEDRGSVRTVPTSPPPAQRRRSTTRTPPEPPKPIPGGGAVVIPTKN